MIGTNESKGQQLQNGYFQSGNGPIEILIVGSCRTVPYVNYLSQCDQLTIRRIDPCDWSSDLAAFEDDSRILAVLKSSIVFIHEFLVSYGMFNTCLETEKNIYQFGLKPKTDILIPNFHDHLILEKDYVAYGALTPPDYIERGEREIEKFCEVCKQSSFPEFAAVFGDTWRSTRYFWRPNHISAAFTKHIFKQMNDKFLHLPIDSVTDADLFSTPHTEVTQRDREGYKISW